MKIEQLIVFHLYQNKEVTLQGIGTFRLDPNISVSADPARPMPLPETAITFEYNPKAVEDPSLVDTIQLHTKKLKPLASADLDSFLHSQKQLLNINMAFNLGDIGTLYKTAQGTFGFVPFQTPASISNAKRSGKTNKAISSILHKYNTNEIKQRKKLFPLIVIITFGIGLTLSLVYLLAVNDAPVKFPDQKKPIATSGNKDTTVPGQTIKATNSKNIPVKYVFKVVFLSTRHKDEALKSLSEISGFGHDAIMYLSDSLYKIGIPFNRPLSDTSQIKDSLNRYNSLANGAVEAE